MKSTVVPAVTTVQAHRFIARRLELIVRAVFAGILLSPAAQVPAAQAQQSSAAVRSYSIPAGPLTVVLTRFVGESGIFLAGTAELAQGKASPGLQGAYSVGSGLQALLAGTGLEAVASPNGEYVLRRLAAPSGADMVLPAVTVAAAAASHVTEGTGAYTVRSASTATRLDLSPRETPQSLSVVTRAVMDDFSLTSVNDMLATATGVNVELVEPDRTYFSVRGFEVSNFLVDGIGLPFATGDQLGDLDTAPYDRVEILRGANGLLAATGNPSGTINFVRKRPTDQLQASAALTLGSWSNRRIDGDVAGPLNESGSLRGRLIAAAQKKDSYLDRYSLEKNVFSVVLEADLAPDTLLTFGHAEQHNRPKGTMWGALPLYYTDGTPTDYSTSASVGTDWTYWNTDDIHTFVELRQNLADGWQAKGTVIRRELRSDGKLLYLSGVADRTTGAGLTSWPSEYDHTERQWGSDLHVSGPFTLGGRRHELVLGVNWAESKNRLHSRDDDTGLPLTEYEALAGHFPEPAFDAGLTGAAAFTNRRSSLYATARFNLTDDLKLITGASVTRATSSGMQYGVVHDYRETRTTPYLGVVYDLDDRHSVYASYAGIFSPQHQIEQSGSVMSPIEGRNVEIGAKGEWFDQRLNGSVALFRTKQDNTAEYAGFANGRSYYSGVDATTTGFELDLSGRVTSIWDISAGYTQFRLEDEDGHDVRTYVPRRTLRLTSTVRIPFVPGLKLGANLKWQDDIHRDQGGGIVTKQKSYALLDLMASYEIDKHFNLIAKVGNVTDEKYLNSLLWAQSYYGAPLNGSVTLQWKY